MASAQSVRLLSSSTPPPPPPSLDAPPLSRVEESSARAFQRDLFLYWSYVRANQPLNLTMKGELYKRDLVGINDSLLVRETIGAGVTESSFPRLVFLRDMLGALGLLQRGETSGEVTAAADAAFFQLEPAERLKRCFEVYATGAWINELAWYPSVYRDAQSAAPLPAPALVGDARRAVFLHLKAVADWAGIAALLKRIQHLDYEFLFKRQAQQRASPYYYGPPPHPYTANGNPLRWQFNGVANESDGWERVEGGFIRNIVTWPLFWMGLTDLAYAESGGKAAGAGGSQPRPDATAAPVACRLTPVGAWLLGAGPAPDIPVEGGQVILQPNFQITAFDPISDAVLMTLGLFAERLSVDRTAEFRLTRASVYAGQKQNWHVARVKAYLQEQTGAPVPANVDRTLDEWQAQHERITIHPHISLIHAAAPADLDTVMGDPQLARRIAARPGPTVAWLVDQGSMDGMVETLLARERLPLVTRRSPGQAGEGDRLPPGSVVAGEDGRLRFTVPAADLYLHGHLARFADPDGEGYRLTPASVGRAARSGLGAPEVLAALQQVLRDPLPQALDLRIRAWSGHYGEAALQQVTLLQVQDAATLKELLADPDLGPLLKPFKPTASHPLALVTAEDLQRVRGLLTERGVDLNGRLR